MNFMLRALANVVAVMTLSGAILAAAFFLFLADTEREIASIDEQVRRSDRELKELQSIAQHLNEYRETCHAAEVDGTLDARLVSFALAVHDAGAQSTFLLSGRCGQCAPDALASVLREKFKTAELLESPTRAGEVNFVIRLRQFGTPATGDQRK